MKVAMLDPSAFTPPYDHHLCEGLAEQGVDVELYTMEFDYFGWNGKTAYERITHFYFLTKKVCSGTGDSRIKTAFKGFEHIVNMATLERKLRSLNPDLIHFQWLPLPIVDSYWVDRLQRIAPVVFTVHDSNPFHGSSSSRIQMWGTNSVLHDFDHLISHTEFTKKELLKKGIEKSAISKVPHGILNYPEIDGSSVSSKRIILLFGTLKPYKGVDTLLRAFADLPAERRQQTTLLIVGQPRMNVDDLKGLADALCIADSVEWDLRFIPDSEVPRIFSQADVVTFPYREIDQSGALLTALPFGKPIVATDVGGFSEVLEDGKHGYLVPPESPSRFADALDRILSDQTCAEQFGKEVQRLAETTYSWERIAKQTIEVYERVQ